MKVKNGKNKPKIAIIHPKVGWGGSEATVLWMLQALRDNYNLSLVTSGKVDIPRLNKYYGTSLRLEDFSIIQAPMPFFLKNTAKFAAIRGRFIQRYCRRISFQFDLMINAYSPCNFKIKGIQFATDIAELPEIIPLSGFEKWFYGHTFLRKIYLKLCDFISPDSPESWKKNLTISNSYWTAELMKKRYGINSQILYPPFQAEFLNVPLSKRENGFICIGRIVPEKRFETAINIIERIRQKGFNIHLHIISGTGNGKYAEKLKKQYLKYKNWVFFENRLTQEEKKKLISAHRFGISCRKNEPFGIAVAEMAKTGCIVFVPDGGGQTEVVENPDLIYKDLDDAVLKTEAVVRNEKLQNALQVRLLENVEKFSVDNFKKQILDVVAKFLKENYAREQETI